MDGCFFWAKQFDAERKRCLHAPRNIQDTRACDSALPWTAGECFVVIFAMRKPSIRMFGHLFGDAEPASD
jgi:hypothetical protein